MFSWMSSGPPYPEVDGWKRVGEGRMEGPGYLSTDFDLLLLEQVLNDHDIRCQFLPHRPGEGLGVGREGFTGVALYVPEERYEEAAALAEELASAEIVDEGGEDHTDDGAEDDVGDDLSTEENSR